MNETPLYDADVIIIGSGVLGCLAATHLARNGKNVIMLEAGPRVERWEIVENFRNNPDKSNLNRHYPEQPWAPKSYGGTYSNAYLENTGPFEIKPATLRLVGGTTWHWTAAAWRYLPSDMQLKSTYQVGRDWPISYEELEPWYQKAEEALGVAGSDTEDQSGNNATSEVNTAFPPRSAPYPLPQIGWSTFTQTFAQKATAARFCFIDEPQARNSAPYGGRPACSGNNSCASVCPTAAMYCGYIHARHAQAADVQIIPNAVVFRLEKGRDNKITAVHYKTPEGETQRLTSLYVIIAANAIETPKLLLLSDAANSSDQVGRNLMYHAGTSLTFLAKDAMWPGRGPLQQGMLVNWRDGAFRRRHAAFKHTVSNAVPNQTVTKRLIEQGYWGNSLNEQIQHDAARWIHLYTTFESLPLPQNRITLSESNDALGIPKPSIHYDIDNYTKAGTTAARQDYNQLLRAFEGTVVDNGMQWEDRHHITGTVIMGNNPVNSVVDSQCRTHDHPNLFLATTGVIPACGVIPPTLTGAALSLRLAQTICEEF